MREVDGAALGRERARREAKGETVNFPARKVDIFLFPAPLRVAFISRLGPFTSRSECISCRERERERVVGK